jgi:hypothetical protein
MYTRHFKLFLKEYPLSLHFVRHSVVDFVSMQDLFLEKFVLAGVPFFRVRLSKKIILLSFIDYPSLTSTLLRISALPKGLISWLSGNQYPGGRSPIGICSENHQITPYGRALVSSRIQFSRGASPWDSEDLLRKSRWKPTKGWYLSGVFPDHFPTRASARLEFLRCYLGNLNDTRTKPIGRKDSPRYVFDEVVPTRVKVASKPSDEGSLGRLRNPLKDRTVQWDRQRYYHMHPYFTDNLRYAC